MGLSVWLFISWRTPGLFLVWGYYGGKNGYKHSCTGFCMSINFHFFGLNAKRKIAGSYGKHMFSFKTMCQTVVHTNSTILNSHQQLISSPMFSVLTNFFSFSSSNRSVVISHCGFNLHFLMTNNGQHLHCAYLPSVYRLGWNVPSLFHPFSIWVLCFFYCWVVRALCICMCVG